MHLINYCNEKNKEDFIKEGITIYKRMFETNSYSAFDVLTYRNIILLCNLQKDVEFLECLANKYIPYLHPDHRVNLEDFASAHFYFSQDNFGLASQHGSKINNKFFMFQLNIRNLLLKVYYELNYFQAALDLVKTFRRFINSNKKLPETFKELYRKYLELYTKLIKIKSGESEAKKKFLLIYKLFTIRIVDSFVCQF